MCYQLLSKKKILPAAVVCMCTSSGRVRLPMTPPTSPAACTGATFLSVCQFSCYSTKFSHLALRWYMIILFMQVLNCLLAFHGVTLIFCLRTGEKTVVAIKRVTFHSTQLVQFTFTRAFCCTLRTLARPGPLSHIHCLAVAWKGRSVSDSPLIVTTLHNQAAD